jgi:uncharacterized DUF497 family protein
MLFHYDCDKNSKLTAERGIGFEEIIEEIANGNLIQITDHHNQKLYSHQKILHVLCLTKVYLVPYVMQPDGIIFLKTLYPSRKATRELLIE